MQDHSQPRLSFEDTYMVYRPFTHKQRCNALMSAWHLTSFTIPVYSRINWAAVTKYRAMLNFLSFIFILWSFYCPGSLQGAQLTQGELACYIVLAVEYIIDVILTLFSIQTLYTNLLSAVVLPLNCILLITRNYYDDRWKMLVSVPLICTSNSLVFALSVLHIVCTACKVNDIDMY